MTTTRLVLGAYIYTMPWLTAAQLVPGPSVGFSNAFEVPLVNGLTKYWVNDSFGTPFQTPPLQVDTGSGNLWVTSSHAIMYSRRQCEVGKPGCPKAEFVPDNSSSLEHLSLGDFHIGYGGGAAYYGDYVVDSFGIGPVVLDNTTFGLADNITMGDTGFIGLGLAAKRMNRTGAATPGVLGIMVEQDFIDTQTFSLWLDHGADHPSIVFGGYDSSLIDGEMDVYALQPTPGRGVDAYQLNVTALAIALPNGTTIPLTEPPFNLQASMDSGYEVSYVPDWLMPRLLDALSSVGLTNSTTLEDDHVVSCDLIDQPGGLEVSFLGGEGKSYRIVWRDMFEPSFDDFTDQPEYVNGTRPCRLRIVGQRDDPPAAPTGLNQQFLRSVVVVHHVEEKVLGLEQAKTKVDPGRTRDIVAIQPGDPFWRNVNARG